MITQKSSLMQHYRNIYNDRRSIARRNGIPFTITFEEFKQKAEATLYCPVFNEIKLSWGFTIDGKSTDNSPSLDRVNPQLGGYTSDNFAIISHKANRIKNNGTSNEHRLIAEWQERQ